MESQSIVVLDFGAQYSQLIARRIREQNIFSVVLPCNATLDEIRSYSPVGIILSGGPSSVYDADAPVTEKGIFDFGLPVLGICYGLQYMVYALGGKVRSCRQAGIWTRQSRTASGITLIRRPAESARRLDVPRRRSRTTSGGLCSHRKIAERCSRN